MERLKLFMITGIKRLSFCRKVYQKNHRPGTKSTEAVRIIILVTVDVILLKVEKLPFPTL